MLSTTIVHVCQRCGSEAIRKNGHAENGGQRAKCLACGRTFVLQPKGARYDEKFKAQVVAAYQDRMSIRGITRTFGVCYETVLRWVGEKAASLPAFVDTLLPAKNGDVLELDELWSFVGAKAQSLWLWVALCRRTRQIVGWTLGDRRLQGACDLRAALAPGYRNRATRSDFWEAYATAFPARTHRSCGKEAGETCHVERWFGTLRARTSRLVRRAYSFSKSAENHLDALHLFITTYNLAILHKATVN